MRKQYSKEIEARLLVESKNTCNICWIENDVQIHHINEDSSDSSEDNLIVLGVQCHSKVHSSKRLAKNYSPETLRLYKATWIDLVKKYPFENNYINEKNDIKIIQSILELSDRRVLYFPFHLEVPLSLFKSIKNLRENIQKSGYRLLMNKSAKESVQKIYKNLIEIEFFFPSDRNRFDNCFSGMMGSEKLHLIELKRQEIIYSVNQLGKLIGYQDDIIEIDEFKKIGFDINTDNKKELSCFGNYQESCEKCENCDFSEECLKATMGN